MFLTTLPATRGFYERLGFVKGEHFDGDLSQWAEENAGFGIWRFQIMVKKSSR